MKTLKTTCILLIFGLIVCAADFSFAQHSYIFIENKKQWNANIVYKADIPGGSLFLEKNCFTYDFFNPDDVRHSAAHFNSKKEHAHGAQSIIHRHAYKVNFLNSSEDVVITNEDESPDYCNYYIGNDPSKWATNIRKYDVVNYQNIYSKTDLKVYTPNQQLKYEFKVYPGGNPENIRLFYDGIDELTVKDGDLRIKTSVNEMTEVKPYVYQESGGEKKQVECNYKLVGNILSFEFPQGYDKQKILVIDPTLVFSTYTGSTTDNWGYTATNDIYGNVFSGGIVESSGYPVNVGAYQINNGGGWDVGVIKYTPDGSNRIYATYLGGNSTDMPHSLVVNEYNELHIFGTTGSSNFPITPGAYDPVFSGGDSMVYDYSLFFNNGSDIFIAKLSADGSQLLGSTYMGGSGNDGVNFKPYLETNGALMHGNDSLYFNYGDIARGEIITDGKNYIYVGTCTFSPDFPVTAGAFQTQYGGKEEGVVFKLNNNLTQLLWSSYIGGTEDDAVYSIDVDNYYEVYVAGGTVSHDFPTTAGSLHPGFQGGTTDGFVAHITPDGSTNVACTYFGSSSYDQVYFVKIDRFNNIYLAGQSKNSGSSLIYNAAYNNPNSGQFISKLNNSLNNVIWSTVFGTGTGVPNISITAFTVDVCNRIYLSGWGRIWQDMYIDGQYVPWGSTVGTVGMDVTPDAFQSSTDGQDFYVMVLADDASQLEYATYFGEQHYSGCSYSGHDHVDGGTSRFDKKGNIYQSVCASCGGCQQFPTYPSGSVWSGSNNSYNCNNAVFRFTFMGDFSVADFILPPTGCVPYTVNFINTSIGTIFNWDFGDGNYSTDQNPTHTYTQPGTYNIQLIASDPVTCNLADTIIKQIQVLSNESDTLTHALICLGDSVQIGVAPSGDPNITYSWYPQYGLSNPHISNPWAHVDSTTHYLLIISNGSCTDSLFQTVDIIIGDYDLTARNDTLICPGSNVTLFANTSYPTTSFLWSYSYNFSNPINPNTQTSYYTVSPTNTITYYIRGNGAGCDGYDVDSVTIQVNQVAILAGTDTALCIGDTAFLHVQNLIPGNTLTYIWSPLTGILSGENTDHPVVSPAVSTTYIVQVQTQYSCTKTDTVVVLVDAVEANITNFEDVICYGDCNGSAIATGNGIFPLQYHWSNNTYDFAVSGLCPGNYTVTVTDSLGCQKTAFAVIGEPPLLITSMQVFPILVCDGFCTGQLITSPSGGTPPYTFHWSNNQTNDTLTGLCVGNYIVTVIDSHGCDTLSYGQILDPSPNFLVSILDVANISCHGYCDGSITVLATGGQYPLSFEWSNGDTVQTISGLCAGTYTVTVIDGQNCIRVNSSNIPQPEAINPFITLSPQINCHDDTTSLTVVISNGFPPDSILWNTHDTTQTIHGVSAGFYQVTVTDSHNCSDSTEITILNPPLLVVDTLVSDAACTNSCNGTILLNLNGGTHPYTINWDYEDTCKTIIPHDSVQTHLCRCNYTVIITDAKGCQLTHHFYIDELNYTPPLDATADEIVIYRGRSTYLHANGLTNANYIWAPSQWLSDQYSEDPETRPLNTTLYQVWTVDSTGCRSTDTITIFVKDVLCSEPFIYIPNAFYPGSTNEENKKLKVYTNMADEVYFAIYDRWGEVVFETTNIHQGWDGTFRGKNLDPAVFVYHLKVTCLNGEVFEKKGNITLIR
ncbi:MAG: gliding motility-associated C-terminal domain-containing protein [Bacteroidia bacterium]|nr:gliding motility-associated C-terminal domain-containing protein [Bacteroidia bacterium]